MKTLRARGREINRESEDFDFASSLERARCCSERAREENRHTAEERLKELEEHG